MIKTQVQLPDELYRAAKALADRQEWSLAETVRRGLETILARYPQVPDQGWELPPGRPLGGDDFFARPDWRFQLNQPELVREPTAIYRPRKRAKGSS